MDDPNEISARKTHPRRTLPLPVQAALRALAILCAILFGQQAFACQGAEAIQTPAEQNLFAPARHAHAHGAPSAGRHENAQAKNESCPPGPGGSRACGECHCACGCAGGQPCAFFGRLDPFSAAGCHFLPARPEAPPDAFLAPEDPPPKA